MKHCHLYFTAKPLSVESLVYKLCVKMLLANHISGFFKVYLKRISQEKSERPSRFFVCKLTPTFPTRKYYCVGMGELACLKYLKKQVCNILVIEIDVFYCSISQGSTC